MIKIKNLIYLTPSVLTTLTVLTFYILNSTFCIAEVRYVSHTGSSTPPYTTWETAADSIQKAIDICESGDTVLVANGVYNESIYIDKSVNLWGSSRDSTIISAVGTPNNYILYFWGTSSSPNNSSLLNFKIISDNVPRTGVANFYSNLRAENCWINNVYAPIKAGNSSVKIEHFLIHNFNNNAIWDECPADTCKGIYTNNIIISTGATETPVNFAFGGYPTFTNNIVIEEGQIWKGVAPQTVRGAILKNNLISGFLRSGIRISDVRTDTAFTFNNNVVYIKDARDSQEGAIVTGTGHRSRIENNIITNTKIGISGYHSNDSTKGDYNLLWDVENLTVGNASLGDSNIIADPMFVKDTIPNSQLDFDYHLQAYSPAIDKGNPDILDVDGSRSDIGMFGGPLGEKYTYMDLAPKPPANLTAVYQSNSIHLNWNKNTEADLSHYRVYRDTVPNFIYNISKMIGETGDTTFTDILPDPNKAKNYYYKITAFDNQENQSAASEEVHVIVTGLGEIPPQVVEEYKLLNNYPNPFNPSTTIPYRLKEAGYVKIMVYNILGELVRVLVNQWQEKGYYEVVFSPNVNEKVQGKIGSQGLEFETGYYGNIVSGIYLLRIEVTGEGKIPRFSGMRKMMLVK